MTKNRSGHYNFLWIFILMLSSTSISIVRGDQQNIEKPVVNNWYEQSDWTTILGPDATLKLSVQTNAAGRALCLSYHFEETQSHALASKEINLALPAHFEISMMIKRSTPANQLEVKLIDDAGNTFMKKWYCFGSVDQWKKVTIRRKDFTWAWGPDAGAVLNQAHSIELGVTGRNLSGEVCITQFALRTLSDEEALQPKTVMANGCLPRWLADQQAYWTMVGVDRDEQEALLCEDGSIEPITRGPVILPVLVLNGKLVTRNEAQVTQSLEQNCLPIPSVSWNCGPLSMDIQLFAHGEPGSSVAYAKYVLTNHGQAESSGTLNLLVQPYQVYPPWQGSGGFSPIQQIGYANRTVTVNGTKLIYLVKTPNDFRVNNENENPGGGAQTDEPVHPFENAQMQNAHGFASGAIVYDFELSAGESKNIYLLFPLHNQVPDIISESKTDEIEDIYQARLQETIAFWKEQVNRVDIQVNEPELVDIFKANIAYNLVTRDGSAFQPGSRSYDKAWMRDGSIAAIALLEAGLTNPAREFIEWYAGFQYDTGEVPPVIDTKADNPLWEEEEKGLIEYDSQGEFIWLITHYYLFTKDRPFLEKMFPSLVKSLQFMAALRQQRLTDEYQSDPAKRIYYGILPKSTSHEGYDLKHSYWDDFWGLKGWEDARAMAIVLGRTNLLNWIDTEYADFKICVYDSIARVIQQHGIDFMPGCAELGDIDPTSTAAAVVYCDQQAALPQKELLYTFRRFAEELQPRLKPGADYRITPYEVRSIGLYLRLGQRKEALDLLRFMNRHCQPPGWKHLAEVAYSDKRTSGYIGDMPHTWVGAEYINAVRTLFVFEQGDQLILGAGIDPDWLKDGQTVVIKNFPTLFGVLSYTIQEQNGSLQINISGNAQPPGGFVLKYSND